MSGVTRKCFAATQGNHLGWACDGPAACLSCLHHNLACRPSPLLQCSWTTRPTSGAPQAAPVAQRQAPCRRRAAAVCPDRAPPRLRSTPPTHGYFPSWTGTSFCTPLCTLLLAWHSLAHMHAPPLTWAGAHFEHVRATRAAAHTNERISGLLAAITAM